MKTRAIVSVVIVLCVLSVAFAQERVVREQTGGNVIQYESIVISSDSGNTVVIPLRIRYDFFVFTRSMNTSENLFTAHGEATIELLDSTGTSSARAIQQINVSAAENSPSFLRSQSGQYFFSFPLPAGYYTIVIKIDDKESKREFVDNKKHITIPKQSDILSGLIPIQNFSGKAFTLFNLGGDVLFSQNYGFIFLSHKAYSTARYSLSKLLMDEEDKESVETNISTNIVSFENQTVNTLHKDNSIELSLQSAPHSNINYISLNGSQLRQGRYELSILLPDSTTLKTTFAARWRDMPISLYDLDLAIEPIQYITTKDDYSELRRGGRESRINKFEEFWKKKDSTPATAYNEVMHEFYRRVDFSMTAFRTLREMNGAITDRGKIYILYGKPTSTERLLNPDGAPKEIWKYNSLNKMFTFEDPSKQGNYKLAENK